MAPRVLFIHIDMRFGGVERQLLTLLRGLLDHGYELELALCAASGGMLTELPGEVRVHDLATPLGRTKVPRLVRRIRRVSRGRSPDAVISCHPALNAVTSAAVLALGAPCGVAGHYPGEVTPGRLDFVRSPFIRRLDACVCVTAEAAANLRRWYGSDCRTAVIPNCVDVRAVRASMQADVSHPWLACGHEPPVGIFVGRLIESKGVQTVLRATRIVNREVGFRLLVVGDGPERARLEAIARDLRIADAVDFLGASANPASLVGRSDVFLFGSRSEGLPTVLLEAMACEVPIVSTAYDGGFRELLTPSNSVVVPVGDDSAMAAAVVRLLGNADERRSVVAAGYRDVVSRFDSPRYVERHRALIDWLAVQRRSSRGALTGEQGDTGWHAD